MIIEKLKRAEDRFREIEQMLTLPDIVSNNKEYSKLIKEYKRLLGDKFLGFQMHEWMNNLASDLRRINECIGDLPWTEENITKSVMRKYPMNYLWLEAKSAKEYALCDNP